MSGIGTVRYNCRYPNCGNKYYKPIHKHDYYNKRFYRFPKNGTVSLLWKDICKINRSVVTDNFFVCEDHFAHEDFMNHTKNRLKVGAIPVIPSQPFDISDHDYLENSEENSSEVPLCEINNPQEKYSFLNESAVELPLAANSLILDSESSKLTMFNIHEEISLKLLRLKTMLHSEKYILKRLFRLYKDGKFDNINQQLVCVSNVFLQDRLEYAKASTTKWSEQDNFLALSFYSRNEKLYKYLCASFYLPPVTKLKHILSSIPFKTGINITLLNQMKLDVNKMNTENQICVLLMDEMMLTYGVNYDETYQNLCGYEDLGNLGKSAKAADRVLVLMIRGLRKNWTQVVSYYFSRGPLKDVSLQNIIVTTVKYLQALGVNVVAFICKQHKTNLNALALLTARIERRLNSPYFLVNHKRINIIFDVRYLLIETKEALMKCKVLYDKEMGKFAKFEHIESAYNLDQSKRIYKQLNKLKDEYFDVNNKTDIKAATTIFSHTVAASIETFVLCRDLPQEAMNTAEFVEIMDMMFDSLNGSQKEPEHYKKLRCALSRNSPHLKFWSSLLPQFEKWKLIDLNSEEEVTNQYHFIRGFHVTLESLFYIWSHLNHHGYSNYLSLKYFNLEPLENLFERISRYGTNNKNPTCYQFLTGLKTEILNVPEDTLTTDNCYNLTSLRPFIKNVFNEDSNNRVKESETYFDDVNFLLVNHFEFHEQAAYLAGYLLHKVNLANCKVCRKYLLAEWVRRNYNIESLKESGNDSTYSLYASDDAVRIVDKILYLLHHFLKDQSHQSNLEDNFKVLYNHEFESFKFCSIHNSNKDIINMCVKLGVYKFVYSINNNFVQ